MQQHVVGQSVRVALLGYGLAGRVFHAPLLATTPGVTIAGILTNDPKRQAEAHRDFPAARILREVSEIQRDQFDFAIIATPNRFHAPLAITLLKAGLGVVVDKPMATSVAQAREMIATSTATGSPLTIYQNRRWDGDYLTARQVIDSGALGTVARFISRFEVFRATPRTDVWQEEAGDDTGNGILFGLGSHLIDQVVLLFGVPDTVYAEVHTTRPGAHVDDNAFVALSYAPDKNGPIVHLWMSSIAAIPGPRFLIQGERGSYAIHELDPQERQLRAGGHPGDADWGVSHTRAPGKLIVAGSDEVPLTHTVPTLRGTYEQFYASFRDTLLHGAPPPVDPHDSLRGLEIIAAARQSAETHQIVHFVTHGG